MSDLDLEGAQAMTEYLRRKSAGGLLAPDPHLPPSEVVTRFARALPRLVKLLDHAAKGEAVQGAAQDILSDRDPVFSATPSAGLPQPHSPGPVPPAQLTAPPAVGDTVYVHIEGIDGRVTAADVPNNDYVVEFPDGSVDQFMLGDLGPAQGPAPAVLANLTTPVTRPSMPAGTPPGTPLPQPSQFSRGDRVIHKPSGEAGRVMDASGPITVDMDNGGTKVEPENTWKAE